MNEKDFAWAAGFFDGEGSVHYSTIEGNRSPRVIMQMNQVLREPLDEFAAIVGVGNVTGPYDYNKPNHRPYYSWKVEGAVNPAIVYEVIGQYMRSEKKAKLAESLEQYARWSQHPTCNKGHVKVPRKNNGFYCPTCFSEQARKNVLARWEMKEVENVNS